MIKIKIYKYNDLIIGFESIGHAEYNNGNDIVCAGISTLTQSLYFALIDICNIKEKDIYSEQKKGFLKIEISKNDAKRNCTQVCFNYMIIGIKKIQEEYSEYVQLKN